MPLIEHKLANQNKCKKGKHLTPDGKCWKQACCHGRGAAYTEIIERYSEIAHCCSSKMAHRDQHTKVIQGEKTTYKQ